MFVRSVPTLRRTGGAKRRTVPPVVGRVLLPAYESEEFLDLGFGFQGCFDLVSIGELNPNLILAEVVGAFIDAVLVEELDRVINGRKLVSSSVQWNEDDTGDMPGKSFGERVEEDIDTVLIASDKMLPNARHCGR